MNIEVNRFRRSRGAMAVGEPSIMPMRFFFLF